MIRSLRIHDKVLVEAGSTFRNVDPKDVGEVTAVENEPHARHKGYRVSVQFARTIVVAAAEHFVLVELAGDAGEQAETNAKSLPL